MKKTALFLTLVLAWSAAGVGTAMATVSNRRYDWYIVRSTVHKTPAVPDTARRLLAAYRGTYAMSRLHKVIYLTMDEGYENGYTGRILDVLKANNVPVTFFVTGSYIKSKPALVRRMVKEGHLVGNHTLTHPNMVTKAWTFAGYKRELVQTELVYRSATGRTMPKIMRMPSGTYSARALSYNKVLGFKTYFWSFAYADWDPANQHTTTYARRFILANAHSGEIMLLHAVSRTNYMVLGGVIKTLKSQGYVFKLLPTS